MTRVIGSVIAVALLILPLPGWAQGLAPETEATAIAGDSYRIGPEDVLEILVWNQPDLNRTVPVRPDGMISLPLVNDIQAAGRTPMELRDTLASKLAEFVAAPGVSVIVSEIKSFKISVLGEVTKPGRYEVNGRTTVLDAIAMAEGFTEYAKKGDIVILRSQGSTTRTVHFDYGYAITDEGARGNWVIQPGDIVIVK